MKKPVIMLVDDDPAVLEALEAALDPAFGEIARVEAFTDPQEVLAEIPRWAAEERPVAVAIVDQKMPGMTGVELLLRLRDGSRAGGEHGGGFDPSDSMRAILLTGYAGLDSALAAKNSAEVDAYLEKPWNAVRITAEVRKQFLRCIVARDISFFVFREAANRQELENLFRTRYEVFRLGPTARFTPENPYGLDLDVYDAYARHLGLFRTCMDRTQPAGYLRVIGDRPGPQRQSVRALADQFPDLAAKSNCRPDTPLPLLGYYPDLEAVLRLFRSLVGRGEIVVEPSRLSIRPSARTRGTAQFLIASTVAITKAWGIDHALLTCPPLHNRFYLPLGFKPVPGTDLRDVPQYAIRLWCLVGSSCTVPSPAKEEVEVLQARFARTLTTCYCRGWPDCAPTQYQSGIFAGTDLFCPYRAREILDLENASAKASEE